MSSYPSVPSEDYTGITVKKFDHHTDVFFWRDGFYVYDAALSSDVDVDNWVNEFLNGAKPDDWDDMTGNMPFSQYVEDIKVFQQD